MKIAIDNGHGVVSNVIEGDSIEAVQALLPGATLFEAGGVGVGWVSAPGGGYGPPPDAEPEYVKLDSAALIHLFETAGGMTPAMVVACKSDPNMEYFWILLQVSPHTSRENQQLPSALSGMEALGYLPDGAQAVLDAWPVE